MIITGQREKLEQYASHLITDSINKYLEEQDSVVLAVPGGTSVSGVFENLKEEDIPWQKVHIFMVDERKVPIADDKSNFKLAKECFVDDIDIPDKNVHPFRIEKGIDSYKKELKQQGGTYDVVLLSSGEDCHVGALYPNHSVLDNSEYFIEMDDSPKPPKDRMSMSRELLLKAKTCIVLFFGEHKKDAFEKFTNPYVSTEVCPAKLVKNSEWYALTDN